MVVGVLVGGLLGPPVVHAATSVVNVAGPSGRKAEVTTAQQLQAVESSPTAYFESGYFGGTVGVCRTLATPASGKAFIISQLSVLVEASPSFDSSHGYTFYRNPTCAGAVTHLDFPRSIGETSQDFHPGLPTKTGASIFLFGTGFAAEAEVRGYTVPAAAVP
jgi:hypothetical protein